MLSDALNDKRQLGQGLIVLFLISPFLILLTHFHIASDIDINEFFWALKNSIWQSLWSGILASVGGCWLALGLIFSENRFSRWINSNIFFLLPNFLPNLFVLIGLMSLIDPYPMGTVGVVIAHVFINIGLCGVILKEIIKNKLSKLSDVALILGSSQLQFYTKILLPLIRKDILQVFFLVFATTFGSFAIPLVVGGGKGINLEILIYEKIKIYNDWSGAVLISILQSSILFLFSLLNFSNKTTLDLSAKVQSQFLESRISFYLFFTLYVLFFYSYFQGVWEGLDHLADFILYSEEIVNGALGTIVISLGAGLGIFFLLMLLTRLHQSSWFHRFLNGYTAPSSALIGFSFLFLGPNTTPFVIFKIILGLSLSYIVYIYKMGYGHLLLDLNRYQEKARLLGASERLIFWRILFPLVYKRLFLFSGIAAFWAGGDFAISKMIASKGITLALLSESFLSHYRIGVSSLLSFILLIIGVFVFLFFRGVQSVIGRKINY